MRSSASSASMSVDAAPEERRRLAASRRQRVHLARRLDELVARDGAQLHRVLTNLQREIEKRRRDENRRDDLRDEIGVVQGHAFSPARAATPDEPSKRSYSETEGGAEVVAR